MLQARRRTITVLLGSLMVIERGQDESFRLLLPLTGNTDLDY
jgi:hypothetical protein